MSSRIWSRLSGVALLIGGLLTVAFITILYNIAVANEVGVANDTRLYTRLQTPGLHSPEWLLLNLMGLLGSALILIGLPAVYASQAKQLGRLGLVGLILTFCAILLTGVFGVVLNFLGIGFLDMGASSLVVGQGTLAMAWLFIVDSVIFIVGSILLGRATMRAGALIPGEAHVPVGQAFILAGLSSLVHLVPAAGSFWVLGVLGSFVAVAAFWLGLTVCGIVLLRRRDTQTAQPALTTAERHSADVRS